MLCKGTLLQSNNINNSKITYIRWFLQHLVYHILAYIIYCFRHMHQIFAASCISESNKIWKNSHYERLIRQKKMTTACYFWVFIERLSDASCRLINNGFCLRCLISCWPLEQVEIQAWVTSHTSLHHLNESRANKQKRVPLSF